MFKTVTVMQPYFFPYLDYFRLPYVSDIFVLLDDVQFPRRGYVHRNKFTTKKNDLDWLTLSMNKSDQKTTKISMLEFSKNANQILKDKSQKFKVFDDHSETDIIQKHVFNCDGPVLEYLESGIFEMINRLQIQVLCMRSSQISNTKKLSGSERIIQIVKELGASKYINSPGGRGIYNEEMFRKEQIELQFLPNTNNKKSSCLERILNEDPAILMKELSVSINS